MPNVWCHLLLSEQFIKDLPDDVKKDISSGPNRSVFRLGCLGPDFFLFHGWSRGYRKSRHEISSYMHRYHCVDALMYGIRRVKQEKKKGQPWWTGATYSLGAISHFIVDSTIHPLVYSIVPKSKPLKNMHVKLEVEMDAYLAQGLGLPVHKIISNPSANIFIPRHAIYEVCRYYYEVINNLFHDELKPVSRGKVLEALQDYIQVFEVLRVRRGLYKISRGIAMLTFNTVRLDWFWHPMELSQQVCDLLDEGHFWDLCDEAIAKGLEILPLVWEYWINDDPEFDEVTALAEIRNLLPQKTYLGDSLL